MLVLGVFFLPLKYASPIYSIIKKSQTKCSFYNALNAKTR